MKNEVIPRKTFSINKGHYEFKQMPFGLKNSPPTLQRIMNNIIRGLQDQICSVYLDGNIININKLVFSSVSRHKKNPTQQSRNHRNRKGSDTLKKIVLDPIELVEALSCKACSKSYRNNIDFALHSKTHNMDGKYSCHFCDYKTTCKYRTETHVRNHEGTSRKYRCEICPKTFRNRRYAIEHKYFHTGEKPFQCEICEKGFRYSESLRHHRRTTHYEILTGEALKKFDCMACNKHYESESGLLRHNSTHHKDLLTGSGLSVLCDICGKRLSCKYKLKLHLRTHTGYKPFCCHFCSKTFTSREQLVSHERVHTGEKPFCCGYCGKAFAQSASYRYHMKTHTGERNFVCPICSRTFISKSNMMIHLKSCKVVIKTKSSQPSKRKQTKDQSLEAQVQKVQKPRREYGKSRKLVLHPTELDEPLRCEECNASFKNNIDFAFHSKTHNKDGSYSCHLCDYKNTLKTPFEAHMRAHEGIKKYKCELCSKTFRHVTYATEHKFVHSGERPFQCEICGKRFVYSGSLSTHRRISHYEVITGKPLVKFDCKRCNKHYESHSGLVRHNSTYHKELGVDCSVLCDICGKRISCKDKLKYHMRTHTGDKPYSCSVCPKKFSKKEQLRTHQRIHTGEKPFICTYCGKEFAQQAPFRYHIKTHTGERSHTCPICGKGFISHSNMKGHVQTCNVITNRNGVAKKNSKLIVKKLCV